MAASYPPSGPTVRVARTLRLDNKHRSRVYDYRGMTAANGGTIWLRACVHHIPVIRQMPGRQDLDALRRVLLAQGLMVQFGTDGEGNVGLYTRAKHLCYHARGGNSVTCGIEHMHYLTSESWDRRQFCAAAWVVQFLEREHGIPLRMATVDSGGPGVARIVRTGHTSHQRISQAAGYNDRSDPGPGFDYERIFRYARYFKVRGHFIGA